MRDNKGFVLITILLLLLLLSVTALTLNSRSGLQFRMSANQTQAVQSYLNQLSVVEKAIWKLNQNPAWRPSEADALSYNGATGTIGYSQTTNYKDAVIISASPSGTKTPIQSFRYFIDTPPPFNNKKPTRMTADAANNIYFADMDNHSVWKVDAVGTVTRFAGDGTSGDSVSQLNSPQGVCFYSGTIYIADTGNHRILSVGVAGGVMTVYAGITGVQGSSDGNRLTATFRYPKGISIIGSSGHLVVADSGNHTIRKINRGSGRVDRIAGTGIEGYSDAAAMAGQFREPSGVVTAGAVNAEYFYVADTGNNKLRKFMENGTISTVAVSLKEPHGVTADSAANIVYVADTGSSCIRKIANASGDPPDVSTYAGICGDPGYTDDGTLATSTRLYRPTGVYRMNSGDIIIADTINGILRKVQASTEIISNAGPQPGAGFVSRGLDRPAKIARFYDSNLRKLFLYIADALNHRILKLEIASNTLEVIAGTGVAGYSGDGCMGNDCAQAATFDSPEGVAVDNSGIYVADTNNCVIRKIDNSGKISLFAGVKGECALNAGSEVRFNKPTGLFKQEGGNIFVADTTNNRIVNVIRKDSFSVIGTNFSAPRGVYLDGSNNVFVADTGNHRVVKMGTNGANPVVVAGTGTAGYFGEGVDPTTALLKYPTDVSANGTSVFIVDSGNNVIRLIDGSPATIKTVAGVVNNTGFDREENLAAVAARIDVSVSADPPTFKMGGIAVNWGNAGVYSKDPIHISDTGNNRIRRLKLKQVKELY